MESKEIFLLRYRSHPFQVILFLVMGLLFIFGGFIAYLEDDLVMLVICLLVIFLFFLAAISLLVLPNREYHVKVDRRNMTLSVARGLYRKKFPLIDLTKVHSISLKTQIFNHNTSYNFQFATDAKTWGKLTGKKEKRIQQFDDEYEEMYYVINIPNQKEADVLALYQFLLSCGLSEGEYVGTILGSYQGVPRKKNTGSRSTDAPLSRVEKRLKIKQIISYFFMVFFISFSFIYIALQFIGRMHGIYW